MPKSKGKRKHASRGSGIKTPQLESQVTTVETAEQETIRSRLDRYLVPFRRLSYPSIKAFKALNVPNFQGR